MSYQLIVQLVCLLLDLIATKLRSEQQKDLEILLLRQQLRVLVGGLGALAYRNGRKNVTVNGG